MLLIIWFILLVMLVIHCIPVVLGRIVARLWEWSNEDDDEDGEEAERDPIQEKMQDILSRHFAEIKHDRNRLAVHAYSEAIQKMKDGEEIEPYVIIYILSELQGTEDVIEEIKGVGA